MASKRCEIWRTVIAVAVVLAALAWWGRVINNRLTRIENYLQLTDRMYKHHETIEAFDLERPR